MHLIHSLISQRDEEAPFTPSYISPFPKAEVETKGINWLVPGIVALDSHSGPQSDARLPALPRSGGELSA